MKMLKVYQAYDRTQIAEIPMDDRESLEKKLQHAEEVFKDRRSWIPLPERKRILLKVADQVESRREDLAVLIAKEGGKPFSDAIVEVIRAADGLRNAAEELRNFSGKEIPMGMTPASLGRLAFTTKEPIGIVAAISAFNHPLNLIVHQISPAIAVGCPVIVKPAAATPLSCLELVKMFIEAGLPEEWCQTFITDDNSLAELLVTDRRVSFLSFIGSAKVGWYLRSKLAPGARCALKHGGAAPVIIDKSADLSQAIEAVTKGGYYHAGQVCVSVQRIFVHKDVSSEFIKKFSERIEKLTVGNPLDKTTEVGPLISPKELDRVISWIQESIAEGTKMYGGCRLSDTTMKPAILVNPSLTSKVAQLEIFGPVTCVFEYDDLNDVIEKANSLPYAFQSSVFSSDINIAMYAAKFLDASTVMINDHTAFRTDWMPFAGRKESGYGVGGIPYTMEDMTEDKMIVFNTKV